MDTYKIATVNSLIKVKRFAESFPKIYVYGAGKWGTEVTKYLLKVGKQCADLSIVVSHKENCPQEILGIKVLEITEVLMDNTCGVIVGTQKKYQEEIIQEIVRVGNPSILIIDEIESVLLNIGSRAWVSKRNKIEVTSKIGCSINCKYCPQGTLIQAYYKENRNRCSVMTMEDYKKCIDHTPEDTIITFSGFVEPFLHPDAVSMLQYAADIGRDIQLFTTLVGLNVAQLKKIEDIPFLFIVLHLPDAEGYANIPITDTYKETLEYILNLKNNGRSFVDRANCQGTPDRDIMKIIDGRIHIDDGQLIDRAGNLNDTVLLHCGRKSGKLICRMSTEQTHWVLLPDGTVTLCCNDFGMQHVLGNLLESTFLEIQDSAAYKSIRRQMSDIHDEKILCRNCNEAFCIKDDME